jgi:hypothetical protein
MAVSKSTRRSTPDTNQSLKDIFRSSQVSADREQAWSRVLLHSETGDPPLRFPVYEHLYQINVHAQQLVSALRAVSDQFSINQTWSVYQQALVQYVRAASTRNILEAMAMTEHTESWLFQTQRNLEEKKFYDPDDIYYHVRDREAERPQQGLPPRIQFLNEEPGVKQPDSKAAKPRSPDEPA